LAAVEISGHVIDSAFYVPQWNFSGRFKSVVVNEVPSSGVGGG
jgi:hypothetical protein